MGETLKEAIQKYPDIAWAVAPASEDIVESFGKGYMLAGKKGDITRDYFVPNALDGADHVITWIAEQLDAR